MMDARKRRRAVFLFFLLALGAMVFFFWQAERDPAYLGVRILSHREQTSLGNYVYRDLSRELQYNGQQIAVDLDRSTLFIPQDIREDTKAEDLKGSLRSVNPLLLLSFAPDEAFNDLTSAVENGHAFKLNVSYGFGRYMQYDLVFTTLPVLRIDGDYLTTNEQGRDVYKGSLCLWMPEDSDTGSYSMKTGNLQWHIRGGWSSHLDKTPFKLDLKKKTGTNQNMDLAGLGADDDWILNPMNLDDTKLKEKLFMGLWNQRADQVSWNEKMSDGEYVEVVINREYRGLFLLQRRIDGKLLNLGSEDVLLKSGQELESPTLQTAYEIIHSGLTEEQTYQIVRGYHEETDPDILNMDNFLDVNLFLQCASAVDNWQKNMYFLLKNSKDGYSMHLLPWDTDMSWGTIWDKDIGHFGYDFEASRQNIALRMEYDWVKKYRPDLDRQMAIRWFQLRKELLTMETMTAILEQQQAVLDASGAQMRDQEKWGLFYEGQDSLENLYRSIEARLDWVDDYYTQYLQ